MKLNATNSGYQLFEITHRQKGESFCEKIFKEHHELDAYAAREIVRNLAKKQVEENIAARKGKIPSLLEMLELDDDEE